MAASSGTDVSSGNTKSKTWLESVGNLALDFARVKYIDSETARDDNNIADRNDLIYRNNSTQNSMGTSALPQTLILGLVALVVGIVVVRKVL